MPMNQVPYRVEHVEDERGPLYRLVGPGVASKWYLGNDQRERLEDIRDLVNHVVQVHLTVTTGTAQLTR